MADLPALLDDLTSGNDERAEAAAGELAAHAEALPALEALLRSPQIDQRWWAVRTLSQFANQRVTELILSALADQSAEIRQAAALALAHNPDPVSVPALIAALADSDSLVVTLAANALIAVGPDTVPALMDVLQHGKHSARLAAVRALAEIKDPRAIPVLMKALEEDSALLQFWAEAGLDQLGLGMIYLKPE
jgi:HEAT repeat protein